MDPAVTQYSALDRLVHALAFSGRGVQLAAADLERTLFGASYKNASFSDPILVTSLPRAGTTLLLEILHRLPGIATHSYRDMPFVLAPVLWEALSQRFRKAPVLRERAHGDGVMIGFDSPEAFEEVLWRCLRPDKYRPDRVDLWTSEDSNKEVRDVVREHFQKIIAIRCQQDVAVGRYASKNNANIARLEFLAKLLPDATILVPVRNPLDHVASLHRQHMNFLQLHQRDRFSKRYMRDIGHFEFGELHRPLAFPSLDSLIQGLLPEQMDYWLGYWIAAYEYVLEHASKVVIVSYDGLCSGDPTMVRRLLRTLAIDASDRVTEIAALFRAATAYESRWHEVVSKDLLQRADAVYGELVARSVETMMG